MKNIKIVMALLCLLMACYSKAQTGCKDVIGYFQDGNNSIDRTKIIYNNYNVLLYAFAFPTNTGTLSNVPTGSYNSSNALDYSLLAGGTPGNPSSSSLVYQMHNNSSGGKVLVSIGGQGYYCNFSTFAASTPYIQAFAVACTTMIERYDLDGIDIDWEAPGINEDNPGTCTTNTTNDGANFTALVKEIRTQLTNYSTTNSKPHMLLTIAADPDNSGSIQWPGSGTPDNVMNYVDFVNVMSYNYNTYGSNTTSYNSPISSWQNTYTLFTGSGTGQYKVSASQLNFGIPFYGVEWTGCTGGCSAVDQATTVTPTETDYSLLISNISSTTYHWDPAQEVPYLSYNNGTTNVFLSYDNEASVGIKAGYYNTINSVFSWDITQDYISTGSPAVYVTPLNDRINDVLSRVKPDPGTGYTYTNYNTSYTPTSTPLPAYTGRSGYIQAGGSPTSYVLVQTPTLYQTSFKSAEYVQLNPGFYAPSGSVFTAGIIASPCSTTIAAPGMRQASQSFIPVPNNAASTSSESVTLYPNPTTGLVGLNVNYGQQKGDVSVTVYNPLGAEIYSADLGSIAIGHTDINLSAEPAGLYIVKVKADSDVQYRKVVLSK